MDALRLAAARSRWDEAAARFVAQSRRTPKPDPMDAANILDTLGPGSRGQALAWLRENG